MKSDALSVSIPARVLSVAGIALLGSSLLVLVLTSGHALAFQAVKRVYLMTLTGFDYERLTLPVGLASKELKHRVPSDARVAVIGDLEALRARYYLAPEVSLSGARWDYLMDVNGEASQEETRGCRVNFLSSGIPIYVRDGAPELSPFKAPSEANARASLLGLLFQFLSIQAAYVAIGLITLRFLVRREGHLFVGGWTVFALAHLAGLVVHNVFVMLAGVLGLSLSKTFLITSFAVLLACGAGAWIFSGRAPFSALSRPAGVYRNEPTARGPRWLEWLAIGFALLILGAIVIDAALTIPEGWDSFADWIYKAKAIAHHRAFAFHDTTQNEYPILWPVAVSVQLILGGVDADFLAQWLVAVLSVDMAIILREILRGTGLDRWKRSLLWGAGLLVVYDQVMTEAYAETLLVTLFAALVLLLNGWLFEDRSNGGLLRVAMLMAAGLTLTKVEGHIIVAIVILAVLILRRDLFLTRGEQVRLVASGCAIISLLYLWMAWPLANGYLPVMSGHANEALGLQKLKALGFITWEGVRNAKPQYVLLFSTLTILALLGWRELRKDPEFRCSLLVSLGVAAFSVAGLVGWTTSDISNKYLIALPRLFWHGLPAYVLCWTIACRASVRQGAYAANARLERLSSTGP